MKSLPNAVSFLRGVWMCTLTVSSPFTADSMRLIHLKRQTEITAELWMSIFSTVYDSRIDWFGTHNPSSGCNWRKLSVQIFLLFWKTGCGLVYWSTGWMTPKYLLFDLSSHFTVLSQIRRHYSSVNLLCQWGITSIVHRTAKSAGRKLRPAFLLTFDISNQATMPPNRERKLGL